MRTPKKTSIIGAGALALVLAAGAATVSASAAVQANGSDGPLYVGNADNGDALDTAGYVYKWDENIFASASGTDLVPFACPTGATGAYTFISTVGNERAGTDDWEAFDTDAIIAGGVNAPNITAETQISGVPGQAALRTSGGTYSMGVACTIDSGVNVVASYYRTISVTAGSGDFTIERNADATVPPTTSTSGDIDLAPTVIGAGEEGILSLVVPAGTVATFGTPTLVGGQSTVTGTLDAVTVSEGRYSSLPGWTLSADVDVFTRVGDASDTIANSQLGVKPAIVSGTAGAIAGAEQTAGAATYASTFAELPAGRSSGDTVVDADLTFVAPRGKAAGTYNSVLTLTVVSK